MGRSWWPQRPLTQAQLRHSTGGLRFCPVTLVPLPCWDPSSLTSQELGLVSLEGVAGCPALGSQLTPVPSVSQSPQAGKPPPSLSQGSTRL